jgi:hypothetical protein
MRQQSAGTRDDLTAVLWQMKKTANTDKYGMYYQQMVTSVTNKQML